MKALIAAACIAVLAFVGYYFWGEYERARAAATYAESVEDSRREIFSLAAKSVGLNDEQRARNYCDVLSRINQNNSDKSSERERVLNICRSFGFL